MKRILCHGDSLTEGTDIEAAYRWPSLLQNALDTEVINTGIGGDTTAGLLSRFSTDVIPQKPDAVILMGGTNDFWWDLPTNTALANLFSMAYQAQFHGIAPLFGLPMPFDGNRAAKQPYSQPEAGYDQLLAKVKSLGQKLKTMAGESDIPVLDFYDIFTDNGGQIHSHLFLDDGLHANRQGHRMMAELAASQIGKLFLLKS
jgi:lysophospholipase L1-like esterase